MFKKTLIMLISFVLVSFVAYGQTPFRTDQQAYQFGYDEGYHHGMADSEAGLNFDYTHSHHFQSGISYNSYVNARFRSGYIQGYKDGYYSNSGYDRNDDYYGEYQDRDRDDHYYSGDYYNRDYRNGDYGNGDYRNGNSGGFVTAFTDDRFGGSRVSFRVGQYPYLNGRLHNSIDSMEVRGPVRVILFDKPNFRGKSIMIDNDVFNLDDYDFGDKAESMIVERY
jgi:Ni/Co efflux regulator RcnB